MSRGQSTRLLLLHSIVATGLLSACGEMPVEDELTESEEVSLQEPGGAEAELAGPTPQVLRPDGTVRADWRLIGEGSAWALLDDAVQQPAGVAANNDYLYAG
ncbi:MAG TPA: hypothetical protein VEY30_14065, partial [Myxococcaceae bacterium]|nr:hypothetical protein [Myxococcaceae bacterium]